MTATRCPDDTTMRAFGLGELRAEELERLAGHVPSCAACVNALDGIDDQSDGLVARLPGISETEPADRLRVPDDGGRAPMPARRRSSP